MPRSAGISVISPRLTLAKFLRAGSAPAAGALLLVLWSSSSGVSRFRFVARKIFFSAHRHSHGRTSGNVKFGLKLRCFFFNPLAAPLPELALATASYRPEMHTKHGQFWIFPAAAQCISAALGDGDRKKKAEKKLPHHGERETRTGPDRIGLAQTTTTMTVPLSERFQTAVREAPTWQRDRHRVCGCVGVCVSGSRRSEEKRCEQKLALALEEKKT